jgi:integrase
MASKALTDIGVRALKPGATRREVRDASAHGLAVVVFPSGKKSYVVRFRIGGRQKKLTLKSGISLSAARKEAADAMYEVSQGRDPTQTKKFTKQKAVVAAANTLRAVAENYLTREERKPVEKRLRTIGQRRDHLERLIYPKLGDRPIGEIRRSEIAALLDKIEDTGPVQADRVLATLRKLMNWHATRDDDFTNPIVRDMARTKPKDRARDRVLTDDELRVIWRVAEEHQGPYDRMLQFILLTATRLREASNMNRSELSGTDWIIPAARYKTKLDHLVPLSVQARALLFSVPVVGEGDWVFTTSGDVPIAGFSKGKRQFDARVLAELQKHDPKAEPLPHWTPHDLRRTARTLLSRTKVVTPDHAERCLGHVIGGIRENYDKYEYREEKAAAFEALAAQIERIVDPQENVVALRR